MTAYNRRFGKAPRHDFDVHRPLETDDDLTAFLKKSSVLAGWEFVIMTI